MLCIHDDVRWTQMHVRRINGLFNRHRLQGRRCKGSKVLSISISHFLHIDSLFIPMGEFIPQELKMPLWSSHHSYDPCVSFFFFFPPLHLQKSCGSWAGQEFHGKCVPSHGSFSQWVNQSSSSFTSPSWRSLTHVFIFSKPPLRFRRLFCFHTRFYKGSVPSTLNASTLPRRCAGSIMCLALQDTKLISSVWCFLTYRFRLFDSN